MLTASYLLTERLAWRAPRRSAACWATTRMPGRTHSSVSHAPQDLTWDQMHFASKLAKWSGLCYYPEAELPNLVKAEGLQLVASGRTPYTSWYIADGSVDYAAFHAAACSAWAPARRSVARQEEGEEHANGHTNGHATGRASPASSTVGHPNGHTNQANGHPSGHINGHANGHSNSQTSHTHSHASSHASSHTNGHLNGHTNHASHTNGYINHASHASGDTTHVKGHTLHATQATADGSSDVTLPEARRYRFVFVRGVQLGAPDANITAISSALMNFWPTPLALPTTTPAPAGAPLPPLVSHGGVTQLAADLYKQLVPFLQLQKGTTTANRHAQPQLQQQQGQPLQPQQQRLSQQSLAQQPSAQQSQPPSSSPQPSHVLQTPSQPSSSSPAQPPPQPAASPTTATSVPASLPPPMDVCIAGHSLGGALGMLVLAQCVMSGLRPASTISCHTFGSPPVLAHRDGGGGHRVLKVLGLSDAAVRSFVLEHDPVPRALLTADPAFNTLKSYGPVKQLLDARGWLGVQQEQLENARQQFEDLRGVVGDFLGRAWGVPPRQPLQPRAEQAASVVPMLSAGRFVFENVGSVYLMRGGAELVPVNAAADVDQLLRLAAVDFMSQPAKAIQAWLDHHHGSYAHDLDTAALAQLKRKLRQARLKHQQQHQHHQHQLQQQQEHLQQQHHHHQQQIHHHPNHSQHQAHPIKRP